VELLNLQIAVHSPDKRTKFRINVKTIEKLMKVDQNKRQKICFMLISLLLVSFAFDTSIQKSS
jgi:hypothetical protein